MNPIRVMVVDDHPMFRQGLRTLLEDLGVTVLAAPVVWVLVTDGASCRAFCSAGTSSATRTAMIASFAVGGFFLLIGPLFVLSFLYRRFKLAW